MVSKSLLAALGLACCFTLSGQAVRGGARVAVTRDHPQAVKIQCKMCYVVRHFFTGEVLYTGDTVPEPFSRSGELWPGVTVGDRTYRLAALLPGLRGRLAIGRDAHADGGEVGDVGHLARAGHGDVGRGQSRTQQGTQGRQYCLHEILLLPGPEPGRSKHSFQTA